MMSHSAAIDLDAYFQRIRYHGSRVVSLETLNQIVAGHIRHIPFENLNVLLSREIRLDPVALQQKLIHEQRGGYCFEQNGLLLLVLQSLGFEVTPQSARVRIGSPREFTPARTHLFLRVHLDGADWLADVGVGGLSPTCAVRITLDREQATPHEPRRIIREGSIYYHQAHFDGQWNDVYEFTLEEMPLIDRIVANWYTSTHPDSHFKNRLVAARSGPDRTRVTLLNTEFSVRDAEGKANKHTITSQAELLSILTEQFGLVLPPGVNTAPLWQAAQFS